MKDIYFFARWIYRYGSREMPHDKFEDISDSRRAAFLKIARAILFNQNRQRHGIDKFLAPAAWYVR